MFVEAEEGGPGRARTEAGVQGRAGQVRDCGLAEVGGAPRALLLLSLAPVKAGQTPALGNHKISLHLPHQSPFVFPQAA